MTESSAFLVFANDVDPVHRETYEDWHASHHVPQRLSVPGIVRAMRYRGRGSAAREYLTVYWLSDIDVLASAPYRRLAEQPDSKTMAMRPYLRNMLRLPCRTLVETGDIAKLTVRLEVGMCSRLLTRKDCDARLLGELDPTAGPHPLTSGNALEKGWIDLVAWAEFDTETASLDIELQRYVPI